MKPSYEQYNNGAVHPPQAFRNYLQEESAMKAAVHATPYAAPTSITALFRNNDMGYIQLRIALRERMSQHTR
jgi:hypothetical protein